MFLVTLHVWWPWSEVRGAECVTLLHSDGAVLRNVEFIVSYFGEAQTVTLKYCLHSKWDLPCCHILMRLRLSSWNAVCIRLNLLPYFGEAQTVTLNSCLYSKWDSPCCHILMRLRLSSWNAICIANKAQLATIFWWGLDCHVELLSA